MREGQAVATSISGGGVALPPEIQGPIGKQLRQVYGQMLAEPLPDKFTDLLARLAKSESSEPQS
jgi:hypothetical protein